MIDVIILVDQDNAEPAFGSALALAYKVARIPLAAANACRLAEARVVILHSSLRRQSEVALLAAGLDEDRRKRDTIYVAPGSDRAGLVQAEALGIECVIPNFRPPADIHSAVQSILNRNLSTHLAGRSPRVAKAVENGDILYRQLGAAMRADRPLPPEILGATARAISEATRREGLAGWLDAVKLHHSGTCRHMLSVAGNGSAFGQFLGLHDTDIAMITEACLLHDVGKLFIPITVLEKDGPLSAGEKRVINTHPARGAFALQRGGRSAVELIQAVRDHHEYLDGSGYPNGISGSSIGPLTRIVTLADIYSALTEERSYKAAMPPRQAIAIMSEMKGKLDDRLFAAFRSMVLEPVFATNRGGREEARGVRAPCLKSGRHPLDRPGQENAA
ncbi:HD-GYP domain-containing protein [Stappia indica]|uniref:HD-GYP domain-containing protein n=1 Tax=Stappia indica TaxID=538381 RepID=UPI00082C02F1|nr:HD domain-containing phosphohydrolase [Stappia indica]MCC4243218.1 HD domain-containing protein [Stappia indica]